MSRKATLKRNTSETQISASLDLDGEGNLTGENPIPFFEHMLAHICKYSLFDLDLNLTGDLEIDCHHSVEDSAIVIGELIQQAIGDKAGIFRYGHRTLPMDDVLCAVTLDLSGRPYFRYSGPTMQTMGKFGIYDAELSTEFMHKLSIHAKMNLHIIVHNGDNRHHIHEAMFKGLGMALREAVTLDSRRAGKIPSTKGSL
jgi:imidazoleglycerol-phosphate dehydratase